jgi:hypothetical protein
MPHVPGRIRHNRVLLAALTATALLAALVTACAASAEPRPPAAIPCTGIGAGKYNCYFYPPGDGTTAGAPVQASSGATVGYLNQGTNYVFCEAVGSAVSSGSNTNDWWAYTEADNDKFGWVNALYARGGENNGAFASVPGCPVSKGRPPGGTVAAPVPTPAPPAAPAPAPSGPAQIPCSAIGAGKYSCNWYVPGDGTSGGSPVLASKGSTVGYLHKGSNWILCQQKGAERGYGGASNGWYGWTEADDGSYGWADAVYASGGANDGQFASAPNCAGAHGAPPATAAAPPSPVPKPSPPPSGGAGPACADDTGPGDNVTRWNPVITCVLKLIGQPVTSQYVNYVDIIVGHESSGDPGSINLTDGNALAGHPSEGLAQVIIGTFNAHKCAGLPDNIWDPAANICAGLRYGIERYGSIPQIKGLADYLRTGHYTYYFAHLAGRHTACGQTVAGASTLSVSSRGVACKRARAVAATIERGTGLRRALRVRRGSGFALRVHTRYGAFRCQVARRAAQGAAQRAVACASGRDEVSWTAVRR